jgi:hypothetical protein
MMNPLTHLEKVQVYLRSIENGDFGYIASLFSPDAVLEQLFLHDSPASDL